MFWANERALYWYFILFFFIGYICVTHFLLELFEEIPDTNSYFYYAYNSYGGHFY